MIAHIRNQSLAEFDNSIWHARQAVARAVVMLDARVTGWRNQLDNINLLIGCPRQCVMGQLFGHYDTGLDRLGITEPMHYGFCANEFFDFFHLQVAWLEELHQVNVKLAPTTKAVGGATFLTKIYRYCIFNLFF